MITLENISPRAVVPYHATDIKKLIKEKYAKSAKDILELMRTYPEYNWYETRKNIGYTERLIELANKRDCKPQIYNTKGYENTELLNQDNLNCGDILLLNTPTKYRVKYIVLNNIPIREIKEDLAHTTANGTTYISAQNTRYRKIGPSDIQKLIFSLEMYEKQIERQSTLTSEKNINLFELNQEEKKLLVDELYNEIIMYLVYNTNDRLVWSGLSDFEKKKYISSAINNKKEDIFTRNNIIKYVANYTTLPELEEVAKHDLKVLNRFIVN